MYKLDYKNAKKMGNLGLPFLLMGILFLVIFGFIMFGGMVKKSRMDATVEADRVEINSHRDSEGTMLYKPTYFYTVDGKEYHYTPSYSTNVGVNKMSDKTLYYNSKDPYDVVAEFESSFNLLYVVIMLFICIFPIIGAIQIKKSREQIARMKKLAKYGTLIRNLEYRMVPTGYSVNNRRIMAIEVDYELPSGNVVTLTGEPRFDRKSRDRDGFVDLLIDLNDPNNYYIDFNILEIQPTVTY